MSENPFQAPASSGDVVVGVVSGRREDLRSVAAYQKGILGCILVYFLLVIAQLLLPPELRILAILPFLVLVVAATVFVFLLATKVYGTGLGVLLGILTLMPCLGLIVLLIINGKATSILKSNGIRVGLLGAKKADLERV